MAVLSFQADPWTAGAPDAAEYGDPAWFRQGPNADLFGPLAWSTDAERGFDWTDLVFFTKYLALLTLSTATATGFTADLRTYGDDASAVTFSGHDLAYLWPWPGATTAGLVGGTVTGFSGTIQGRGGFAITGLSVPVESLMALVRREDAKAVADANDLLLAGDDLITGSGRNDALRAGPGDDTLAGGAGDDRIDGGAGTDTARYSGNRADYTIVADAGGGFRITDNRASAGGDGTDTATGVEVFRFADGAAGAAELLSPSAAFSTSSLSRRQDNDSRSDFMDTADDSAGSGGSTGRRSHELHGGPGHDTAELGHLGFRGVAHHGSGGGNATLGTATDTYALTGIREVRFADGRLVFDDSDPAAQVARLYEAALDRLPDQAGLNFWIGAVQHGHSLHGLAAGFLGSGEFQARFGGDAADDGAFVDRLYQNVLGRAGEQGGRDFWVGSLHHGAASRAEVLAAFSESAENKAGTAALVRDGIWDRSEAAAEVARLYDAVLGRLPDAPGLAAWKDAVEHGAATPAQVADAFAASAEFRARYGGLDDRGFADALYRNTLQRAPDQAGLDHWTEALRHGGASRAEVVLAFSESAEHVGRTGHAIQSETPGEYGILFA